jgi:hypothetical protein
MTYNPSLYRIGYLSRLPLKTPYPGVVEAIRRIMGRLPRETTLITDFTGVGRGIFDLLVDGGLNPTGVTMTGGIETHRHGYSNISSVPKSTLVSKLVARVHSGGLVVHGDLADWPALKRELLNFRSEVTATGSETWNARSGEHDDLVIATALCVWGLGDDATPYSGLMRYYAMEAGALGSERFCVGVDLGQAVDPTAICVMSRIDNPSLADVRGEGHFKPA